MTEAEVGGLGVRGGESAFAPSPVGLHGGPHPRRSGDLAPTSQSAWARCRSSPQCGAGFPATHWSEGWREEGGDRKALLPVALAEGRSFVELGVHAGLVRWDPAQLFNFVSGLRRHLKSKDF